MIEIVVQVDGQAEVCEPLPGVFLLSGADHAESLGRWVQILVARAQGDAHTLPAVADVMRDHGWTEEMIGAAMDAAGALRV